MKRKHHSTLDRFAIPVAAILVLLAQTVCAQDFIVRMTDEHGESISTHYVSRNAVRNVASSPVHSDMIYRMDTGTIITLNDEQKAYSETSAAELRRLFEKRLSTISPEEQEMMRRMGFGGTASIKKIGAGETIAGYATEKYAASTPLVESEIWLAPAIEVPPGYYDMLTSLITGTVGGMGLVFKGLKDNHIKGFLLKSVATIRTRAGRKGMTVTEFAASVEKGPIPASTFEPPAGYRKMTQGH